MTSPQILVQFAGLQKMMRDLLASMPQRASNDRFDPELALLGWYLGRSVYRETYWLREVLAGDNDLTDRVRALFTTGALGIAEQCARLPPPDHLLEWATEIQDEHLRRLATPGALPANDLLENDRLQWFLLQESARDYERMLMVLHARRIQEPNRDYRVREGLEPRISTVRCAEVEQGHYRIGSRNEPFAYDNELPPQGVELSGFRIAKQPVTNAEYLAFMEANGYGEDGFWGEEARRWRDCSGASAPVHWRRDALGLWYGVGLNGLADLQPDDSVSGVSRHEAQAFAAWVAGQGGELSGAVLQHEYQWEIAARSGRLEKIGQVWEWCANPFHAYPQFEPHPDSTVSQYAFGGDLFSLRGASLHTQRCLRRASFRNWAASGDRQGFTGIRLVFPPL